MVGGSNWGLTDGSLTAVGSGKDLLAGCAPVLAEEESHSSDHAAARPSGLAQPDVGVPGEAPSLAGIGTCAVGLGKDLLAGCAPVLAGEESYSSDHAAARPSGLAQPDVGVPAISSCMWLPSVPSGLTALSGLSAEIVNHEPATKGMLTRKVGLWLEGVGGALAQQEVGHWSVQASRSWRGCIGGVLLCHLMQRTALVDLLHHH